MVSTHFTGRNTDSDRSSLAKGSGLSAMRPAGIRARVYMTPKGTSSVFLPEGAYKRQVSKVRSPSRTRGCGRAEPGGRVQTDHREPRRRTRSWAPAHTLGRRPLPLTGSR